LRHGGAILTLLSSVAAVVVGGSCGTTKSTPYDGVDQWQCFASNRECTCAGVPDGTKVSGKGTPVTACSRDLDCCFVKQNPDLTYTCTCVATPADPAPAGTAGAAGGDGTAGEGGAPASRSPAARCLEVAAQHDSTTVTAHCPPITLDSAGVCAVTYESCESAYLEKTGLIDCCDGLVCQADASGQKVCVTAP
jgi:hypothetical protein